MAKKLGDGTALMLVLPALLELLTDYGKPFGIHLAKGTIAQDQFQQSGQTTAKTGKVQGKSPLMGVDVIAKTGNFGRIGQLIKMIDQQFHRQPHHGDMFGGSDRMFTIDSNKQRAFGHLVLGIMQMPQT